MRTPRANPDHLLATHASERYGVPIWGHPYFFVADDGKLHVRPDPEQVQSVPLSELVTKSQDAGFKLPILVRFPGIIANRIKSLHQAFQQAITSEQYAAAYTPVFPIKVNQQQDVVQAVVQQPEYQVGLEAGSKPELLAVLALSKAQPRIIICNGYKDRAYLRYALIGQQMGHKVFVIIEKLSELTLLLEEAAKLGVTPQIGLRVRLSSLGTGKWQNTGGDKAKFGLSASQMLAAVKLLQQHGQLENLQVLHFHMGSQIANIRDIQKGMREGARYYCELKQFGAPLTYLDVGGGLGVDYEGTGSRSSCSMNYTVDEYAHTIVKILKEAVQDHPLPHILTEAGRATVAHHAVLITNAIDREPALGGTEPPAPSKTSHPQVHALWQLKQEIEQRTVIETYHEASYHLGEVQTLFDAGSISLEMRAQAELIYFYLLRLVRERLNVTVRAHRELFELLNEKLATKYFLNFSIFQSTPDIWAIDQVFPVLPIEHLNRPLTERGIIQDLTCDSDGRIDHYLDNQNVEASLPMPDYESDEPIHLALCLVGAYQETLGDMHNLFGDTNAINVAWDAKQSAFVLLATKAGDSAEAVLQSVAYDKSFFADSFKQQLQGVAKAHQEDYLQQLMAGLADSTYLA